MIQPIQVRGVLFLLLVLTLAAGCSTRQPARSLADLQQRIRPGHTLYVVDATGTETRGKLTAITPSGLTLIDVSGLSRTFDEPQIRQVQRYGDSLWNGALTGGLFGAIGYLFSGDAKLGSAAVGLYGAIGAGIDTLMRSRHQVFLAPGQTAATRGLRVAPFLHQRGAGVALAIEY